MKKILRNKLLMQIILVIAVKFSFDLVFAFALNDNMGLRAEVNILKSTLATLIYIIFAPFIANLLTAKTSSSLMVVIIFCIHFSCISTLFAYGRCDYYFYIISVIFYSSLVLSQYLMPNVVIKTVRAPRVKRSIFMLLILITVVNTLYLWYVHFDCHIQLDFLNIYEQRALSKIIFEDVSNLSYTIYRNSTIIYAMYAIWIINSRKYCHFLILIPACLMHFSLAAHKSFIGIMAICLSISLVYKLWMKCLIPLAIIGCNIFAAMLYTLIGERYFLSYIIRRCFFVPAMFSVDYVNYAQANSYSLLTGILSNIGIPTNYIESTSIIIGQYNGSGSSANTGLVGEAYLNLGLIGVILIPIIIVFLFRIFNTATVKLNPSIYMGLMIYFCNSFLNSNWFTILLSHGFLITCILLYLYPEDERNLICKEK